MSEKRSRGEGENIHAAREERRRYINREGGMIDKCGKVQKRGTIERSASGEGTKDLIVLAFLISQIPGEQEPS